MTGRRDLGRLGRRRLAALWLSLALAPAAAGAAAPDPRLARNPALARVAAADPARAQRLLDDIEQALRQPPRPPMRGSLGLDAADEALLAENPLLGQVYAKSATAALELLRRIKAAGEGKS